MSKPTLKRPRGTAQASIRNVFTRSLVRYIPRRLECVSKARVNEWKRAWAEEFNKGVSNE